jgi:hypothetical protein
MHLFPRTSDRAPWQNKQNYLDDREHFRNDPLEDGVLKFTGPTAAGERQAA